MYNNELDVIKRAKKLKTTKNGTEKEVVNKNRYLYGALELVFNTLGVKEYFECQYGNSTYFAFRVPPVYLMVDKSMPKMIDIDKFEDYLKDLCLLILRAITSPPLLKKTITYADRFYLTQKLMLIVSDLPTVKSCAPSSEKLKNLMRHIDKYYHEHSEKFDLDTYMEQLIEITQCTPKERKDSFKMWCYIKKCGFAEEYADGFRKHYGQLIRNDLISITKMIDAREQDISMNPSHRLSTEEESYNFQSVIVGITEK